MGNWKWFHTWAVLCLGAAIYLVFYDWEGWRAAEGPTWAAWAQAVGATAGIAIAIWVPYKQRDDAAQAEQARKDDEIRRICIALRDDLLETRKMLHGAIAETLLDLQPREYFADGVIVLDEPNTIFTSVIGRLTLIEDDVLRGKIISTYRKLDTFAMVITINNRMLEEFGDVYWNKTNPKRRLHEVRLQSEVRRLRSIGVSLKESCREARTEVDDLIPLLEARGRKVS